MTNKIVLTMSDTQMYINHVLLITVSQKVVGTLISQRIVKIKK